MFGKVSTGGFKISSSSESESEGEEEETSKQKSQWSSTIEASKTTKDSDSDDSGVDENNKGKFIYTIQWFIGVSKVQNCKIDVKTQILALFNEVLAKT